MWNPTDQFTNVPPQSQEISDLMDHLTAQFIQIGEYLLKVTPTGREQSVAFTKLEETLMWVKKSVALNQDDAEDLWHRYAHETSD